MLKQHQPGPAGRKTTSNGTSPPTSMSSTPSGPNSNRTPVGRSRTSVKPSFQSSAVFEGVYNNARMLHFLTAVVGSTCDIRVKNGNMYEGIFKTLSARCELAVDAVHKRPEGEAGPPVALPRREEITDTMIFPPGDLVTMTCRDVDLNFATRDTFTDTGISTARVNGEHKEKVLQRWDGGDSSNGERENYDLEKDSSNGWDANEMFRYNEAKYGITSTYDSSLSMYTVPLERGSSEGFRQREARAARLANEIEASPQYRQRVNMENDDGKSEEDKFSAVLRDAGERERGRDSPGATREGKYIPLPQRQREINRERERAERGPGGGPGGPPPHSRLGGGYRSNPPASSPRPPPSSSSPRPPSTSSTTPQPPSSDRSSPLPARGYGGHHAPSPTTVSPAQPVTSPALPHSQSLPHSLADGPRPVNGVSSRTSPKAQRPPQSSRPVRSQNTHSQTTAARSPKSGPSHDTPFLDTSSVQMPAHKTTGPTPLFPVDVNEIVSAASKERSAESPGSTDDKMTKAPSMQQRSQIEELRKFGKEFRVRRHPPTQLQPTGGVSGAQASAGPLAPGDAALPPSALSKSPANPGPEAKATATTPGPSEEPKDLSSPAVLADRQSPATPQPARTPGSEDGGERPEGVVEQVKKSTLNPNAKEFNPVKALMTMVKPATAPTPPRPTPPSPVVLQQHPGAQGPLFNGPYLSYVSQIHSVQPPQMFQYTMSTVNQGKYPRGKGSLGPGQRADHGGNGPPMLQAAASAAGAPLVASPYPQQYLQYNPQQYGQQQVLQAMAPYPGQPMYSMLQGGARMITQGGAPHPQAMGPPGGAQFQTQGENPQVQQQGLYAPQGFAHHAGQVHQPQPSSTPTGNQPQPQHAAPSPGQNPQGGPQPQSMYHSGPMTAPTPPNMPPGHTSPQASYSMQGYSIHGHQGMPHSYNLGQITQAHVQGAMGGPHPSGGHGHQVVMLPPPQQGPGSVPQHPQQGAPQHYYLGHPQAMQVQTHPSPFHPPGN
ncbi:unnamed protein product [Boreogadus saida]